MKENIKKFIITNRLKFIYILIIIIITILMMIYIPKLNDEQRKIREAQDSSLTSSIIPPPDTTTTPEIENPLSKVETIGKYNNPTVPKGFHTVDTETTNWQKDDEGNVIDWNEGLVIEDDIGNQFVWIPVKDIENFEKHEGYYQDTTQEFLEKVSEADYSNSQAFVESISLYESIKKYQGFYLARYEAGIKSRYDIPTQDGTLKPLSTANAYVWDSIAWGSSTGRALDGIVGSDISDGAVKVARSMYPNTEQLETYNLPEDLTNDTGVISTLVYGIQWDLTMDFLSDVVNENNGKKFIENSSGMGNYEDSRGDKIMGKYSTKNIFDLAGNVYEWTMESYSNEYRIIRGGKYDMGTTNSPSASMRSFALPNIKWYGFRVALYIK